MNKHRPHRLNTDTKQSQTLRGMTSHQRRHTVQLLSCGTAAASPSCSCTLIASVSICCACAPPSQETESQNQAAPPGDLHQRLGRSIKNLKPELKCGNCILLSCPGLFQTMTTNQTMTSCGFPFHYIWCLYSWYCVSTDADSINPPHQPYLIVLYIMHVFAEPFDFQDNCATSFNGEGNLKGRRKKK